MLTDGCDERGPIPQLPTLKRSHVYRQTAHISSHSFRKYANAVGCEHHYSKRPVTTRHEKGNTVAFFEVLRIIYDKMYDSYDNLLYVDADVVCNTEEDVFEVHGKSGKDVSGICESSIFAGSFKKGEVPATYASWDYDESKYNDISRKYAAVGIPIVTAGEMGAPHPSSIFTMNTGVMVWSREARLRARKVFDDWKAYMATGSSEMWLNNDQPFISGQLAKHGFTINHLDQTWNDSPPHYYDKDDFSRNNWNHDKWKDRNFLHYTGGFGKKFMLDDYARGMFKHV